MPPFQGPAISPEGIVLRADGAVPGDMSIQVARPTGMLPFSTFLFVLHLNGGLSVFLGGLTNARVEDGFALTKIQTRLDDRELAEMVFKRLGEGGSESQPGSSV